MDTYLKAKVGLYLDDPYGDGCRLDEIRNPNEGRQAAIRIIDGEPEFWDDDLVEKEYGDKVRILIRMERRRKRPWLIHQNVLNGSQFNKLLGRFDEEA